jgi:hypothetical protein
MNFGEIIILYEKKALITKIMAIINVIMGIIMHYNAHYNELKN